MTTAMTDTELADWLTDIGEGCQPTAEAFRALARRCAEAEARAEALACNCYDVVTFEGTVQMTAQEMRAAALQGATRAD